MSNLKRVISMFLAAAMIFSMSAIMAYADEDTTTNQEAADAVLGSAAAAALASLPNDDVKYADAYKFDYALGVFEMLEDGYWQKNQVTRSEFATVVAKMIKANTDGYPRYDYSPYVDIDRTNFAYPAVCYLTDIGILNGDGNSEFRPNDPILVNEATKMIMCAIGFKDACELNGGYPGGYNKFATIQGIYNNLSFSNTSAMTAMEMAKMVRNALEAKIMDKVIYREDGTTDAMISETKTLLTETYKMENLVGTVEGTYFSYFSANEVGLENEVIIDGVCYQFDTNIDMEAYLGYEVNFYYMEDVSGYRRPYIAYCEPRNGKNTEIDIMAKDIVSLTASEFVYSDANGNERRVQIQPTTEISYNGKPFFELGEESLVIKEGHVKAISHDSASRADAVIIQEQFDGLFERYNKTNYQVVFQDNMTQKIPEVKFDTAYRTRLTLDGSDIKPEDLVRNDAITYMVSKDGEYIRGYVSRTVETGQIARVTSEEYPAGSYKVVTLNGKDYFISPYCAKEIETGFDSDFQISYDGRIVGSKSVTALGGNYGYLIKFAKQTGTFDTGFMVKLLDSTGTIHEYESAMKITTNDGQVKASEISEIDFPGQQVVAFTLNSDGKINTLYKAFDYTASLEDPDDLDFGRYFNGITSYSNGLFKNCAVDDNTLIFRVPYTDRDIDTDYSVITKEDLTQSSYSADIYDIRRGIASVVVLQDRIPTDLDPTANTLIVDYVSTAWDEAEQIRVNEVSGWSNGKEVSLKLDEQASVAARGTSAALNDTSYNKTITELKRGDVIQYNTSAQGYIYSYRVLFNCEKSLKDGVYFDYSVTDDNMNATDTNYNSSASEDLRAVFGVVERNYDQYMLATKNPSDKKWQRSYRTTGINLYIYDVPNNEIIIGEPFDINPGDKVFIRCRNMNAQVDMLVIQE